MSGAVRETLYQFNGPLSRELRKLVAREARNIRLTQEGCERAGGTADRDQLELAEMFEELAVALAEEEPS